MLPHRAACVRSALWIASFFASIGLMNGSTHGQQMWRDNKEDSSERYVLLNSGRVLRGPVTPNAGGYLLDQNQGKIQLSVDDVKCIVNSLHDAYCKQRDSIVEPTPATHLALANWCISFRLYEDASEELKKCLKADPENEAARRLRQRLTEVIRASQPAELEKAPPRKTADGFAQPDVESLGGMSKESALQFVTRIQPLMLHKCGNASCHGLSASNEFKVISPHVSGRSSRHTAERNLAETFRQIDFDDVASSKLLAVLKGPHGGKGAIFTGQSAAKQTNTLQAWVYTVVQEKKAETEAWERKSPRVVRRTPKPLSKQSPLKAASAFDPVKPFESTIRQASFSQDEDEEEVLEEMSAAQPKLLKSDPTDAAAMARVRKDAFDPEEFNRQFHRP